MGKNAVDFDYDKGFIEKNPRKNIRNQYQWATYQISKQPLTEATKNALKIMFGSNGEEGNRKIDAFLKMVRGDNPEKFSGNQEKLLRNRVDVLRRMYSDNESDRINQLSELRKYRKEKHFK